MDAADFRPETHPIHLVWFGSRSPLQLGLMKYLDVLGGTGDAAIWPYLYLDLGRLEGMQPCLFDAKAVPAPLRAVASLAQDSMESAIRYEITRPRHRGPAPRIPLYGRDGALGSSERAFIKFNISSAGISSQGIADSRALQAEMVFQVIMFSPPSNQSSLVKSL